MREERGENLAAVGLKTPATRVGSHGSIKRTLVSHTMNTASQKSRSVLLALLVAVLGAVAFSGCRTMNGMGQDIERAGEKIQDNARH